MVFVIYLGPKWMRDRDPYNLRYLIVFYNACQVYYNWWIIKEMLTDKHFLPHFLTFGCVNATQAERNEFQNETYRAYWHGTMNKLLDLLDTVFFVLTKKQNHITFLHVQHHAAAAAVLWTVAKYYSGLEIMIVGLCNMTVHMVMYFYYFISSLGPRFKKYLWWKKHLTLLQIAQLITIITYSVASLWLACGFNKYVVYLLSLETGINLVLFLHFYFKNYGSKTMSRSLTKKIAVCGELIDSWPLFGSPLIIPSILLAYALFVLYFGPKFMKNRDAYNLKYVIILYNAVQVYYNYWILKEAISIKHFFTYFLGFGCAKGIPVADEQFFFNEIYRIFWHGTMNKMLDLLDTIFFVLTKKQSHITFLHVHHHMVMVATIFVVGKYYPGLEPAIIGFCNTIVHMVMYFYYLLAALGPNFKKYLWWKKYLTVMQMIQFVIILIYASIALGFSCGFNKIILYMILGEGTFNLVLFMNFYKKSYGKEKRAQAMKNKLGVCGSLQIHGTYDVNGNAMVEKKVE
uniref:Elongation of very long chain fatty acids protein n=1 Tax=Culicoides sonorensis TaxID=179676 RepID=A0A336KCP6_CULSO